MDCRSGVILAVLLTTSCADSEENARRVLIEAEAKCGLPSGTLKFLMVQNYDEGGSTKTIYVSSQDLGRFAACLDSVAQANDYDRVRRLVTY
jgi:hypothetical protein